MTVSTKIILAIFPVFPSLLDQIRDDEYPRKLFLWRS